MTVTTNAASDSIGWFGIQVLQSADPANERSVPAREPARAIEALTKAGDYRLRVHSTIRNTTLDVYPFTAQHYI